MTVATKGSDIQLNKIEGMEDKSAQEILKWAIDTFGSKIGFQQGAHPTLWLSGTRGGATLRRADEGACPYAFRSAPERYNS